MRRGGVLVTESECGAYGSNGLYRYPEDRFLAKLTGIREIGRRALGEDALTVALGGHALHLPATQWLTPFHAGGDTVLGTSTEGPLAVERAVGQGRVLMCGTYMGDAYYAGARGNATYTPYLADFQEFLRGIVRLAGIRPAVELLEATPPGCGSIYVRVGRSEERRMAYVFFHDDCQAARLRFPAGSFVGKARDLISDQVVRLTLTSGGEECDLMRPEWGLMVLIQEL